MKSSPALLVAILLCACSSTTYGDVVFSATVDTASAFFGGGVSQASIETQTAPPNTTDFSSLGETELCFAITAPTGQLFHANFPEAGVFIIRYSSGDSYMGLDDFVDSPDDVTFVAFNGDPLPSPLGSDLSLSGPGGNSSEASALYEISAGSQFSFQSVTICSTIPAFYDADLSSALSKTASLEGRIDPASTDYGQFVSLVAVPEPSALLLLSLLGVGVGGYRRLRFRRFLFASLA